MSDKDAVLEAVQQLSDDLTFDEILLAAIRRGEQAAAAGQVVSHAELEQRARSWNLK